VDALYRSAGTREWVTVDPVPSAAPRR
jgi:hypothetical protein